jgi:hypothetical protein
MDFSNKSAWAIVGVPLLALAAYALFGESDRSRFDRLHLGMSAAEVRNIIYPPTSGKYAHFRSNIRDNEILNLNDRMVLTVRNGVLVDKQWIEKEERKKFVAQRK